jgi:flagellar motor switch protein FliM
MSDREVLSEEEVDALLDGVESGEVSGKPPRPAGEVVPYDLTDQDHIVRGQFPVLEKINAGFMRLLEEGLGQMLQREVEVTDEGLQTVRTSDYIHSLGLPVSVNFIRLTPLAGDALVVFDPGFVFTVVDIYFGGSGRYRNQMIGREFTPTEQRITQLVLNQVLQNIQAAWEPVLQVSTQYLHTEIDPEFSSIAGNREMLMISGFRMETDGNGGEFHVALPVSAIEPVRDLLDGGQRKNKSANQAGWLKALQQNLQEAEVEVCGRIAETQLTLRDVVGLKPGDVIPVNLPDSVTLQVSGVPLFSGQFGVHGESNAVRIKSRIDRKDKSRRSI